MILCSRNILLDLDLDRTTIESNNNIVNTINNSSQFNDQDCTILKIVINYTTNL